MTITYQYCNTSYCTYQYHTTYLITYQYVARYATRAASGNQSSTSAMQSTTATAGKGNMPPLVDCCQHATASHKILSRIQEHLNQPTSQPANHKILEMTKQHLISSQITQSQPQENIQYNSPQHLISPHITKFLPQGNKALQSQLTTIFNHGIWITYHIFFLQFSAHMYS